MAGTDVSGSGSSMDYEYESPFHSDRASQGGRASRCPAMASYSNSSHSYPAQPVYNPWQGQYTTNSFMAPGPSHGFHFNYATGSLADRGLPNPLPEPRAFLSIRPQHPATSGLPGLTSYSHGGRQNYDVNLVDPSPSPPPAIISAPPNPSASRILPAPSSNQSGARVQLIGIGAPGSPGTDSSSSPSIHSVLPASETSFTPAQRDTQSSSGRPLISRAQLPAPSNARQGVRVTMGTLARYRELTNYLGSPDHEGLVHDNSSYDSERDPAARALARQSQLLRGRMNNKRVASRKAIQSLEKVDVESLDDTEKTCVICYNDFGVASPEGIVETPLRLPKCKHVFGNECIIKWLQESYSCPYCRDKLESEIARPDQETIRRMVAESDTLLPPNFRRLYRPDRMSERWEAREALVRAREQARAQDAGLDNTSRGERRAAPPEDSSDAQRRQRPRFSADSYNTAASTLSAQSSSREQPAQRVSAWQLPATLGNHWAAFHHHSPGGLAPQQPPESDHPLPSFVSPGQYMPIAPGFPPMYSREDYYHGPSPSDMPYMGASGMGSLAVRSQTRLPSTSASPLARHLPFPGNRDPLSHLARRQEGGLQPRFDAVPQGDPWSSSRN